ncbi:hypothetical protein ACFE04_015750 [Oxalis oulophora]
MEKKKKVDSSSPVGVLEDYFKTEESETTTSKDEQDFIRQQQTSSNLTSRLRGFIQLLRSKSKNHLPALNHPLDGFKFSLRRSSSMRLNISLDPISSDSCHFVSLKSFSLSELQTATNNFSPDNLIGKGGYAQVYRGCLSNGQLVAIKKLTRGTPDEVVGDFLSELGIMAHVNHPNTAKLIGYGIDGGMHLVLGLSLNGSLAFMLQGSKDKLKWNIRYKIALGTAEGILYLHEGCKRRIIHRDIKAANILVTEDFEPQICDFGLAKWLPEQWTHHVISKFEGTFGYLAPEFLMHGIVDEKTDVFAFGVLLLELVTGRRALDYSQQSLVMWAKPLLKKNDTKELIDPSLGNDYDFQQLNLMLFAAVLCIQQSSLRRPQISQVIQVLKGNLRCLKCMKKCRMKFIRKAFREELFNEEEYQSHKSSIGR